MIDIIVYVYLIIIIWFILQITLIVHRRPRRGFHINRRSTFYGDVRHEILPTLLFPWIENKLLTVNPSDNSTAYAFLMLIKNLRWVIIQDSAILLGKYKRKHFIFKKYESIFESELFLDYQRKMLIHVTTNKDKDSFIASVEGVLPGVK